MSLRVEDAAMFFAPPREGDLPYREQRLAGSGGTQQVNATPMLLNKTAILLNSQLVAIRVAFSGLPSQAGAVGQTNIELQPGQAIRWTVTPETRYVYVIQSGTSTAFESWAWTCSGGVT